MGDPRDDGEDAPLKVVLLPLEGEPPRPRGTTQRCRGLLGLGACVGALALIVLFASSGRLEPISRPRDVEKLEESRGSSYSVCEPNPSLLVWDEDVKKRVHEAGGPVSVRGWLLVPLIHEVELLAPVKLESPLAAVRVSVHTDCTPKQRSPIVSHCGGPGSGAECLNIPYLLPSLARTMDNLAISQRGITHDSWDSQKRHPPVPFKNRDGTHVAPFPSIICFSPWATPIVEMVRAAYAEASLDPRPLDALLATYVQPGGELLFLYNETLVRVFAHLLSASASECRVRPEYQALDARHPNASVFRSALTGHTTLLDFASTTDLARDLDLLRMAVGSELLSLWGTSYGTVVSGAYATMFAERVGLMVLDGNVGVDDNIYRYGEVLALSYDDVWNGLTSACDASYFVDQASGLSRCPASPYATEKLLAMLVARRNTGQVLQLLKTALDQGITGWGVAPSAAIAMACIQSLYTRDDLNGTGCCAAELQSSTLPAPSDEWTDPDSIIQVVRALDMAGRLNPQTVARFFAELAVRHPLGVQAATNILYIASSPTLPRPTPPFGSTRVKPLIIGTLNDPATTYAAAQDMASFFPQGKLLTWQGYLHGFQIVDHLPGPDTDLTDFQNGGYGAFVCTQLLKQYLLTGELPQDGVVCPIDGPAASALSLDVAIAHAGLGEDQMCL